MKKTNTASRLKEIMNERNLRQIDILNAAAPYCKQYGVKLGKNDLSQYVNGKAEPGQRKLTVLGLALNVSPVWLMGYDVQMKDNSPVETNDIPAGFSPLPETSSVPRVGNIACGDPITAEQNIETYDEVPKMWNADFTLVCVGDSMLPRIQNGDVVAVKKTPDIENGEIAAVRIDDEATLKHLYRYPDRLVLQPENPSFEPIILIGEEMRRVTIEGKAVGLCRNL